MSRRLWSDVDSYIAELLLGEDPALDAALQASADAGLPPISVSPTQGKLLHLLARMPRRAQHPGDRHAGRLQHDLAGAGAARRAAADHAGGRPKHADGRRRATSHRAGLAAW